MPAEGEPIQVDVELDGSRLGIASSTARGTTTAVTAGWAPPVAAPHVWLDRLLMAWTADPDGHAIQLVRSLR